MLLDPFIDLYKFLDISYQVDLNELLTISFMGFYKLIQVQTEIEIHI